MSKWLKRGLIVLVLGYPITTALGLWELLRRGRIPRHPREHTKAVLLRFAERLRRLGDASS
jgi:hypothetical protein